MFEALAVQVQKQYDRQAIFTFSGRPIIPIKILDSNNRFQSVQILADTGNDITLITPSIANQLGINYKKEGKPFLVAGISGNPSTYYMVSRLIQLGNMAPVTFRIGVGSVPISLLGREDTAARYSITFKGNQICFSEMTMKASNISTASGVEFRAQKFLHM